MKTPIAFALVAALGASFAPAQIPDRPENLAFPPLAFQPPRAKDVKAKLKNGIPAFLAPDPSGQPIIRLTVSWKGGSYLDPRGKEGLAQMAGQLLSRGGTASLTPEALEERLEATAAQLSSSTGDTQGSLSLLCLEKDFPAMADLLMDVLQHPAFAQERLDLAKRSQRQAMERRNDAVTGIAQAELQHLLFGDQHFATLDPTATSLESLTRADLQAFHGRLLHPANLLVTVSGRFDRKAMLERLNGSLGSLKPSKEAQASPKVPAPSHSRKPGIYVVDKAAPQAMVQWAWPGLRRTDPDWHAAVVMNQILGASGFTSRLMKKIRSDEGLTYGVRTALGEGPYWQGDLTGGLQTNNRTVAYALRLALAEIERLKAEPVGEEELRVIKEGLVSAFPASWSGKTAVASRFAEESLVGWPEDWWMDYREKIQAVTAADVQRMARRLLDPAKLVILAVGKAGDIQAGDPDHPGALKDIAPLPIQALPLRDPLTLQPLK